MKSADYLFRKIAGQTEPLRAEAETAAWQARAIAANMIRRLDWKDFETSGPFSDSGRSPN